MKLLVDDTLKKTHETKHHMAYGFLLLVKKLRWVIFVHAASMIEKRQRDHVVFKTFKEVFETKVFGAFLIKILKLLSVKDKNDPNKLGTLTRTILPYVN